MNTTEDMDANYTTKLCWYEEHQYLSWCPSPIKPTNPEPGMQ